MLRFSLAGIPVTIHTSFLITAAVFGLMGDPRQDPARVGIWIAVVIVSVLVHELGHALMFRFFDREPVIELHGMGGTTAAPQQPALPPLRHMVVTMAGPAAGLLLGVVVVAWRHAAPLEGLGAALQDNLVWTNIAWSVFNLMPVLPLDGGSIAASLNRHLNGNQPPRVAYWIGIATGAFLAGVAVYKGFPIAAIFLAYFAYQNGRALGQLRENPVEGPHPALALAMQALQDGRLEDAMRFADKVLRGSNRPQEQGVALHVMANAYIRGGRPDDALKLLQNLPQGMTPSPLALGDAWAGAGNMLKALQYYRDAFRSQPGRESAQRLVAGLLKAGSADEARALLSSEESLKYPDEVQAGMAEALFVGGLYEEALKVHAYRFNRGGSIAAAYNAACACVKLGRREDALVWLKAAVDKGFTDRTHLETDPDLEPLRGTPDWQQLVSRVGSRPPA